MSDITIEDIAGVIKTELAPINNQLLAIENTLSNHMRILNNHTAALDTLLKKKKTKEDENIVSLQRFKRLEDWAQKVGEKLGVKLEL